ncbi:MAG: cation transporter [Verrucomicrobiaceae bacterium]|nr:cation transporter [Verrucomicrobiaceae bacterium]
MKHILITSVTLIALAVTVPAAETKVVLGGVHNCCDTCAKGIEKAIGKVRDASVTSKGGTVTVTTKSKSEAKKAVEALNDAGYFGSIEDGEVAIKSSSPGAGADKKVKTATVSGAHNCCDKCRAAIKDAVKTVPGVTDTDVTAKAGSFKVTGEFSKADVIAAMNKAGFAVTVK